MKKIMIMAAILSVVAFSSVGLAGWDTDLQKAIRALTGKSSAGKTNTGAAKGLSESEIIAGLKEALHVSTENAVISGGKVDGYFANPAIKILMPEKLLKIEKGLRKIGAGKMVDDFILSMNRAAEQAAPSAKQIFWDAIKDMSFDDARKVFTGNDTAATEYFKTKTSARLGSVFLPIVAKATDNVGVTRKYKSLTAKVKTVPYLKMEPVDIDQYVVSQALNGLFYLAGEEEKKIRKDPAARITDLLKQVFGSLQQE